MKKDILKRHIRLSADEEELSRLEAFIEKICDDYHVYDMYFGNILAANMLAYELFMDRLSGVNYHIDLYFESGRNGMYFTMELGDVFLDAAALFDKAAKLDPSDPLSFDGELDQVMMIRLMADEISVTPEDEKISLIFHISGVNDMLTNQRIELLEKYFEGITKHVPQT